MRSIGTPILVYYGVRLELGADSDRLIVGGADHKSGEANDGERRFAALEGWIRELGRHLGRKPIAGRGR